MSWLIRHVLTTSITKCLPAQIFYSHLKEVQLTMQPSSANQELNKFFNADGVQNSYLILILVMSSMPKYDEQQRCEDCKIRKHKYTDSVKMGLSSLFVSKWQGTRKQLAVGVLWDVWLHTGLWR